MRMWGIGPPHLIGRTLRWSTTLCLVPLVFWLGWIFYQSYAPDLLITGGLIVDGTGQTPYRADVAIRNGKIIGISKWRYWLSQPKTRIYADGKVVAPGFIDVHTHVEGNLPNKGIFKPENFLWQGVTTIITGNCGRSRTDVGEMLAGLEKHGTLINVATLVGHNSVRRAVMGQDARVPTAQELLKMQQMVGQAMEDGALGFSTGLAYTPGRFAQTQELVSLARAAAERGGIYASHVRDEAHDGEHAIQEALEVGRRAGAVTQISHLKCSGRAQWQTMQRRLELLNQARAAGLQVYADAYPYDRSSTTTDVLLPDWAVAEKRAGLRQVATDVQLRQRLQADILSKLSRDGWTDLHFVTLVAGKPEWIGRSLADVPSHATTLDQQVENLIEISLRGGAQAVFADMHETDVALAIKYPFGVFGSDSAVRDAEAAYKPHPRGSGTFPRLLRSYVRERSQLDLAEAIRKASGFAAEIFGLAERGTLLPGNWADIVIFDFEQITDKADYEQPFAEPVGIDYVIVNGAVTVERGTVNERQPAGMSLRNLKTKALTIAQR
ncbi:MAG: D-aminoacylase [Acidobacteria bacterium]|nr:D-aminoacylase [Acidobacteriota bacterium]